jgi:hypothetical protein
LAAAATYLSNAQREDMVKALREAAAKIEGRGETERRCQICFRRYVLTGYNTYGIPEWTEVTPHDAVVNLQVGPHTCRFAD